jgi:hypothetical protein
MAHGCAMRVNPVETWSLVFHFDLFVENTDVVFSSSWVEPTAKAGVPAELGSAGGLAGPGHLHRDST